MNFFSKTTLAFLVIISSLWAGCLYDNPESDIKELETQLEAVWNDESMSPFSEEFQQLIKKTIDSYQSFSNQYPTHQNAAVYLFKAANYTETYVRDSPKSITLYELLREQFPEHELAGDALFNIGWIYNNSLKDTQKAEIAYRAFIQQYPEHKQMESAQFEIKHLGMSDQELFDQMAADSLTQDARPNP